MCRSEYNFLHSPSNIQHKNPSSKYLNRAERRKFHITMGSFQEYIAKDLTLEKMKTKVFSVGESATIPFRFARILLYYTESPKTHQRRSNPSLLLNRGRGPTPNTLRYPHTPNNIRCPTTHPKRSGHNIKKDPSSRT